jgi:hypothetical protein
MPPLNSTQCARSVRAFSSQLAREINWRVAMIGDLHVFLLSTIATSISVILSVLV